MIKNTEIIELRNQGYTCVVISKMLRIPAEVVYEEVHKYEQKRRREKERGKNRVGTS